jgi:hypothetical protein
LQATKRGRSGYVDGSATLIDRVTRRYASLARLARATQFAACKRSTC